MIHVLVAAVRRADGVELRADARESVRGYKIPTLGISEAWHYVPLVVAGALIVLFSIEHIIALRAAATK